MDKNLSTYKIDNRQSIHNSVLKVCPVMYLSWLWQLAILILQHNKKLEYLHDLHFYSTTDAFYFIQWQTQFNSFYIFFLMEVLSLQNYIYL